MLFMPSFSRTSISADECDASIHFTTCICVYVGYMPSLPIASSLLFEFCVLLVLSHLVNSRIRNH